MSKKEKRRAARQAFPKAKSAASAASRGRYAGGTRGRTPAAGARSRTSVPSRGRGQGGAQALRPPTIKKAVITGAVLAFAYFAFVEWGWKSGASTEGNALLSLGFFFFYSAAVYGVERWKYKRKLRRLKGSSK